MLPVLLLFLIPVGGGIPAGVLLARERGIAWPVAALLYFVSDVILALVFEPLLRLAALACRSVPRLAHAAEAMREAMLRSAARHGGPGAGPIALIMIAFGVDPMTGRTAAAAAGHGFVSGWAIAITGDMLYYALIAASTLKLSKALGDPNKAMALVLAAMIFGPGLFRKAKDALSRRFAREPSTPARST